MRNLLQKFVAFSLATSCVLTSIAQKTTYRKFGDVKPDDFAPTAYPVDSGASAVVLFDIGSSSYQGNNSGHFSIAFKRHTRIRLLNKNSFDLATFSIPIYEEGMEQERIESLEAVTYNIENGKIETFKLDKASIFKEKYNSHFTLRKFTLPNLKEGSIIELKYSFLSPYERYLRDWQFQEAYPVLYSEYRVNVPTIYDYIISRRGVLPYCADSSFYGKETYNIVDGSGAGQSESFSFTSTTAGHIWAMKDVPAIKKQSYVGNMDDYTAQLHFQLSKIRYPNRPEKNVMSNWFVLSEDLMKDEDFGASLLKPNGWISDEVKMITKGEKNQATQAKMIYAYIRDNFTCNDNTAKYLSNPLKKTYQLKNGNVADINLLLTAFMLNIGLEAKPVLLSTRGNGKASAVYPVMDKFNYVVCQVRFDEQSVLLDASRSRLGFGKLKDECYNGFARVIDKEKPVLVDLSADSVVESENTSVFIINSEKGGLEGTYNCSLGQFGSDELRDELAKSSVSDFMKKQKKSFPFEEAKFENESVDSLKLFEEPIVVKYDFAFKMDEDLVYLNPMMMEAMKENPFKAAERLYPVEMEYAMDKSYNLRMEIPKGYKVEEIPKSTRVSFNEDEGMFEYLVSKDETVIMLRTTIKLKKATFLPEDYQSLRDFFDYIVKKQSEQIVLKKK